MTDDLELRKRVILISEDLPRGETGREEAIQTNGHYFDMPSGDFCINIFENAFDLVAAIQWCEYNNCSYKVIKVFDNQKATASRSRLSISSCDIL